MKSGTTECDCQNPIENGGFSEGCEVHTVMSEAEKRTQQWLRELELDHEIQRRKNVNPNNR